MLGRAEGPFGTWICLARPNEDRRQSTRARRIRFYRPSQNTCSRALKAGALSQNAACPVLVINWTCA